MEHLIRREITAFIIDRQARGNATATIEYYQRELDYLTRFLTKNKIKNIDEITSDHIRRYLIELRTHRNNSGVHASFRAMRSFFNWWGLENENPAWRNPLDKIHLPEPSKEPLPGIPNDHINALIASCSSKSFYDRRDKAIFIFLFDTGLRRKELLDLDYGDIDLKTGAIHVRDGKGSKDRVVFLAARARRELTRYLRLREELREADPLWTTRSGSRLKPPGLRMMFERRMKRVNIPFYSPHAFRRSFAIECLRNGMDLVTLMRLMGHTSTTILQRYLKLVESDLRSSHSRASPADNLTSHPRTGGRPP